MGGIFGRVTGQGSPLEGARVEEVVSGKFGLADENGDYVLSVFPGFTYTIRASSYGYAQEEATVFVPEETFVEVNFDLTPAQNGQLAGTVTDSDTGLPVEGVEIEALNTPLAPVFTDASGDYSIQIAGGASYDVSFSKVGYQSEIVEDVAITEGGLTTLDLPMSPFPKIFVWEPDPTPISGTFIKNYFRRRGQDVLVSAEIDTYGELAQFEKVFVCLGMSPNNVMIDPGGAEDLAMVAYLDSGPGHMLYIEGGDFWAFDPETDVRSYFNIAGINDGDADLFQVDGVDGTPTQGLSLGYLGENRFVDDIAALGSAVPVWRNPADGWWAGVLYRGPGGYLTIGQSFEIGGVGPSAASSYLDQVLAHMD
jgi:hypothetical protein